MKRFFTALAAVVCVILSSCDKSQDFQAYLIVDGNAGIAFSCTDPEPQTLRFKTNCKWAVTLPQEGSWVSVTPSNGGTDAVAAYYEVTVTASPDESKKGRETVMTVKFGGKTRTIAVSQSAAGYHLCSDPTIPESMIFSTTLGRNSTNVAQGFDYDPVEDVIYITQKYGTWRNHIGWQKRTVKFGNDNAAAELAPNYMTLGCFSHGNNIAIERTSDGKKYVWAPNYSNRESDGSYDNPKIVSRFPLQSSTTVMYNTSTTENYYFGQNVTWPAFDFENDMMAICNYSNFYVYRLSELMALPSSNITLAHSITYGGSTPVDTKIDEFTGKPVVNAKDCRSVKPLYTVKFDYRTRALHWQTYCISDGWIYAILQADKKTAPAIIFDTYVECYKMDGTKNIYSVQQAYMQNRERILEFGWTDSNYFYCEPEGIKVYGDRMLLLYTIRGEESDHLVRRPVIFEVQNPATGE